ncbi:hypothetical protein GEMRC1_008884 [Eukaryota sp. GEM-RC1]
MCRKSRNLTDHDARSLGDMIQKNTSLLVLNLSGITLNSSQFKILLENLEHNTVLKQVSLPILHLECLILVGEALFEGNFLPKIDFSHHEIDVLKRRFRFSPLSTFTPITAEEVHSLHCFVKNFSINELTLDTCSFTDEALSAFCDLITNNHSLTSVNFWSIGQAVASGRDHLPFLKSKFSDFQSSRDDISEYGFSLMSAERFQKLFIALQSNPCLTYINLRNENIQLDTLLTLFDLVSSKKVTPNVLVNPHDIDGSRGIIRYQDRVENSDLIALLKALKSGVPIKRVDCRGWKSPSIEGLIALFEILSINKSLLDIDISPHFIDIENGVFVLLPNGLPSEYLRTLSSLLGVVLIVIPIGLPRYPLKKFRHYSGFWIVLKSKSSLLKDVVLLMKQSLRCVI